MNVTTLLTHPLPSNHSEVSTRDHLARDGASLVERELQAQLEQLQNTEVYLQRVLDRVVKLTEDQVDEVDTNDSKTKRELIR